MEQDKSIKTFDLKIEAFKIFETDTKELNKKKDIITKKQYKAEKKQIAKQLNKRLKQIDKQYPIKKEIEKFLQKD